MTQFIALFKPEHFYPVPEGTILKYRGHSRGFGTDQYTVVMDVIGSPPENWDTENNSLYEVGTTLNIPIVRN